MNVDIILKMTGGLGLFLYGMKLMSDGLEKAAGAKLRSILELFTKNKFIGMIVGIIFTAIVQSSSATTVLVVSFVNAGLMNLFQASGVILGANIGTTITSQLIAFNLTAIAPLFLMAGVVMAMFCKKPFIKRLGEVILGFGILFVGMSTMSGAMETLQDSPKIIAIISSLHHPFLALFVGLVVTAVLQSSSATVGIVLLMASQGFIPLQICFYIILGCNIGSCVSALMASLGAKKEAQRAAWIHFLFNFFGSTVIIILLFFFKREFELFITSLTNGIPNEYIGGINPKIARDVANTHTIFKVFQVLILFPISNWIVAFTYKIVPGKDEIADEKHLKYIGEHSLYSPTTAVPQAISEIEHMGKLALENLDRAMNALLNQDNSLLDQVYETEAIINYMNKEITNYLVKINQLSLPVADRKRMGGLFHVVNDIERIGDHAENLADFTCTEIKDKLSFSKEAELEIKQMFQITKQLLEYAFDMFSQKNKKHLEEILAIENEVDKKEKELQTNHVRRLKAGQCDAQVGMIFSDLVSNLERVADHGTNIAFSILKEDLELEFPIVENECI